jgi:HD-GYP domain-containing protein (c-di-GMP phosphodiesterase class II)
MLNTVTIAEQSGTVMAYLEVIGTASSKPTVFSLHDEVVIGRDQQDSLASDKYLCIPEHTVSRRHARVRRRGETYFVEDLHSSNGTFVLGNRLRPGIWHPLRDGDELSVSSALIVFHSLVAPSREAMPTVIAKSLDATQVASLDVARQIAPGLANSAKLASQDDLQKSVQKLHAMAQVSIALGAVKDRATLIEKIMNFIFDLFPLAERAFILLKQNERAPLTPVAARRRDGTIEDPTQVRISRTIVNEVLNNKQSVLSVDTLSDRHFATHESIVDQAIRSVMCVPLIVEQEVLGLIQVDTSSDPYAFKEADLEMLTGVCAETAVALKNFQLYSDIERLLDGFVRASVQAIEERDPVTAGHSFRVAGYAEQLAIAVDRADAPPLRHVVFTKDQLREIHYAALLHDFGKVGVREHVLRKEKKLHHADMRLLELRFKYARACLEQQAYRQLADLHEHQELNMAAFKEERKRVDAALHEECGRLDQFLANIRRANEPAISHAAGLVDLSDIRQYTYRDADGIAMPMLDESELFALSIAKGCLTPEERRQIESHVADSYSFLILIPWTRDLASVPAIAHGHHEKLDGSGYPMGLRGSQISLQTRILTICDIFDALTAGDRPYKKAVPLEDALDLMDLECQAGHLDTDVFNVFVESKAWFHAGGRGGSGEGARSR